MPAKSLQTRPLAPLLTGRQWRTIARRLAISERELQIAKLVFEDHGIGLSPPSLESLRVPVRTHLERLFRKLRVKSRVALVLCVFREFLADAQEHC